MNVKRSLVALASTGAVAAVIFGGSAVATNFTDNSSGSIVANAAGFGGTYSTGDLRIDNAIPGDHNSETISYTNNGSTNVDLVVSTDGLSTNGPAGLALAKDVQVSGLGTSVSLFDAADKSFDVGKITPHGSFSQVITLTLPTTATNADATGGASIHYTLTATAIDGTT
jgi:hypothetical protein